MNKQAKMNKSTTVDQTLKEKVVRLAAEVRDAERNKREAEAKAIHLNERLETL
jgi:outer membrane murein-binding lipoprotein Lpp